MAKYHVSSFSRMANQSIPQESTKSFPKYSSQQSLWAEQLVAASKTKLANGYIHIHAAYTRMTSEQSQSLLHTPLSSLRNHPTLTTSKRIAFQLSFLEVMTFHSFSLLLLRLLPPLIYPIPSQSHKASRSLLRITRKRRISLNGLLLLFR